MYLSRLSDKQKEYFMDLCIIASKINSEFSDDEKIYIRQYADEMNIEPRYSTELDLDKVLDSLNDISTSSELNGIFIELIALLMCDGSYDVEENDIAKTVAKVFKISDEEFDGAKEAIYKILEGYEGLAAFVG